MYLNLRMYIKHITAVTCWEAEYVSKQFDKGRKSI